MISFYPGPSKLYPQVAGFMQEAFDQGILSINHRSPEFVALSKSAIFLLKQKLNIPSDYQIFFVSSATECWEIIAQSLTKDNSFHIYNGAFGEKWYDTTSKLISCSEAIEFEIEEEISVAPLGNLPKAEIICITQNETSNGTQIKSDTISAIRNKYPDKILAVDATSSLAGIPLEIRNADLWFASVQKCFGMPSGLGLMICSPKVLDKAKAVNDKRHYNNLLVMYERMQDWQTIYTPNVLNIYLLKRLMETIPSISEINLLKRAEVIYSFFEQLENWELLVKNKNVRSDTVIAVQGSKEKIKQIKERAGAEGILLGNGYGKWKDTTFRIANFPAVTEEDIKKLKGFFNAGL